MSSANWTDAEALRYIASYPDLIRAFGANPAAGRNHYNSAGLAEGRAPNFDPLQYTASYNDLINAFGLDVEASTRHYIGTGFNEGRAPSFNALRYTASYADLTAAFGADTAAATRHFITTGRDEGRVANFDAARYTASYADLALAFGTDATAATQHYLTTGFREGRTSTFDALRYTASYADLALAFGTDTTAATRHYLSDGAREGRTTSFDALSYTASYADLIGAFGTDRAAATRHYLTDGAREGRTTSFDPLRYTASYADLISAFGTDTVAASTHYIANGFKEGRSATFDSVAYLLSNPDLGAAGLNARTALTHWITNGANEFRTGDAAYGREQASHALAVGQTVAGTLETATDRDWFQLNLVAGQGVRLEWTRPATTGLFFGAMTVVSDNGTTSQLGAQTISANRDLTGFVAPTTGVYYVSIALPAPNTAYAGPYTLSATAFASGQTAGGDFIAGTDGNDTLLGGAGADWLFGRRGNDTYVLSSGQTATIVERPGEGFDEVRTGNQLTLPNNVEILTLTGTANIGGDGNATDNVITGNSGNNILNGRGGNDTIDGGAGADQLGGGTGNDVYFIDNPGDVVVENVGEGTDTVNASITLTLAAAVENLTLIGVADVDGTGNGLANTLTGNSGRNTLNGLGGVDTLVGGGSDDIYIVDRPDDIIVERAGEGFDQVNASSSFTLPAEVEFLFFSGTSGFTGTGNGLENYIVGSDGADLLSGLGGDDEIDGGNGNDTLIGGAGRDLLNGGDGADTYAWSTSPATAASDFAGLTAETADLIVDFSQADGDRIDLTGVDSAPQSDAVSVWNWIGSAAFQTGAAGIGQLRFEQVNGRTLVLGDYNGDAIADIAIAIDGAVTLNQISPGVIG